MSKAVVLVRMTLDLLGSRLNLLSYEVRDPRPWTVIETGIF